LTFFFTTGLIYRQSV